MDASDFGELSDVLKALGTARSDGSLNEAWLGRPGDFLQNVLSDPDQRAALLRLLDQMLEGEKEAEAGGADAGREWYPILGTGDGTVRFYFVIDEAPSDHVRIGLGVRLATAAPVSKTSFLFPLFRAGKGSTSYASDPVLIDEVGGSFLLLSEIELSAAPPAPGTAGLRAVGLSLRVPTTTADGAPSVALELGGLQLPGGSGPKDLSLSVDDASDLDDAVIELLLGLVQAAADEATSGEILALAKLLGLSGSTIPSLPLDRLFSQGVSVLADWFAGVMASAALKTAWMSALAEVMGGAPVATLAGDTVTLNLGGASVDLAIRTVTGAAGRPVVTPSISFGLTDSATRLEVVGDLVRLDLGTGEAVAVPSLRAQLRLGSAGSPLLAGDPSARSLRVGVELDQSRRPLVILALDEVTIGANSYPVLDLSSPDALAETATTLLGDVITDLMGQLGPAGAAVSVVLGITRPASAPTLPTVDIAALLANPLGALRSHWDSLLSAHQAAIPAVLAELRPLLAEASVAGDAITGTGGEADPWKITIAGPLALKIWTDGAGSAVVALAVTTRQDMLGQRCTVIETALQVGLVHVNLRSGEAAFASAVEARLDARARGARRSRIGGDPVRLEVDRVSARARWTASGGLTFGVATPNPSLHVKEVTIPLDIPDLDAGFAALSPAQWDAVELLLGLLAEAGGGILADLVGALGWRSETLVVPQGRRASLRLADVATDPATAIADWLLAAVTGDSDMLADLLQPLARALGGGAGSMGRIGGTGAPDNPFTVALGSAARTPRIAAWVEPHGPEGLANRLDPEALRRWRPAQPGLAPFDLARAILQGRAGSEGNAEVLAGLDEVHLGLEALRQRWAGGDGRIAVPASLPAGGTAHVVENTAEAALRDALDYIALFGAHPETVVHVAVASETDPWPFPNTPADRVIDLRARNRAPGTFAAPAAASGTWYVALAPRTDAGLDTGDPDGVQGQAQRLRRVFDAFAGVAGSTCVVADAAASHAAWIGAEGAGSAAVDQLVTLGMALSPAPFSILDLEPGAGALRLLTSLLPDPRTSGPDDADLAAGRALIGALNNLRRFADPAAELSRPPALPTQVAAGLSLHALYGRFDEATVLRGMTAVAAASLSGRARASARQAAEAGVTGAGLGLLLPIEPESTGITVSGHASVEVFGVDAQGVPALRTDPSLRLHLEIRSASGWLLGGPGLGTRAEQELRWLEIDCAIPLRGSGTGSASVTLHDARIFGISRPRWHLREAGAQVRDGVVTTALPEARVLLSSLFAELAGETATQVAAFLALLRGLGVLDQSNGFVAVALDRVLNEPAAQLAEARAVGARLAEISAAATAVFGSVSGLSFDLALGTVSFTQSGTPGLPGLSEWRVSATLPASGAATASLSVGTPAEGRLQIASNPAAITFDWSPPGGTPVSVPLWPSPRVSDLTRHAPVIVTGAALHFALDHMRRLDVTARPLIDAALDAASLLAPADPAGHRAVIAPIGLLLDPAAWFASGGAGGTVDATRVIAIVDALKPFLGVAGGAGEWAFTPGFALRASGVGSSAELSLALDSSGFAGTPNALSFGGAIGLRLGSAAPQVAADIHLGLAGAAAGRSAAHLVVNGGVRLFLRPAAGADIPLYPNPAGLGALAQTAVTQALPMLLNAVVSGGGTAGTVTAAVGDALALREGTPLAFTAGRLGAWAQDPATEFRTRWSGMAASGLGSLTAALGPAMPSGVAVTSSGTGLAVSVGAVSLGLDTSPFRLSVAYADTGLPFIGGVDATLAFDATGLQSLNATVGPAIIPASSVALRPVFAIDTGHGVSSEAVSLGLALDASGTQFVALQTGFDPLSFQVVFDDGSGPSTNAEEVAAGLLAITLEILGDFLLDVQAIKDLLATSFPPGGSTTVEDLLTGVVLKDTDPSKLETEFFRFLPRPGETAQQLMDAHLARVIRLVENAADAAPVVTIDGVMTIGIAKAGSSVGVTLGLAGRLPLASGGVVVSLENDSRWIEGEPPAGITLGVLDLSGTAPAFDPSLEINGVGLRIGKQNAPLLDSVLQIGSVALHLFGRVGSGPLAGGIQIQISDLALPVSGGTGGNPVAQGIMGDASGGEEELAPAFSPAFAVQKDGAGPVKVSLSAGEGDGPWWLAIRKGFGPLYVEQVGLGTTVEQDHLRKISVYFDGRITIVGLTAAVDDLQLTYALTAGPIYDPLSWKVDLAGLAVSADISGVTLSGGLRKYLDSSHPEDVEYVGMLMARIAAYGLSIYGGYAKVTASEDGRFTAFFAYGAVVGPIGGPPAFFLTGIGGGFGINREIALPDDLSQFGDFVMIRALDPSAPALPDPMAEMDQVRSSFPAKRGQFWFAAGISFTSFAIVDGIAVVAVEFGKGFELNILGLARMALPRPQFRLVSIELALLARFSSEDGVIWIQAQLTDNSWLLHESVRLTGGFAYVSWFGGPNKGEFVLTIGGYHPNFHRDGYPQVPRLGFNWQPVSNIVIKGENYFALTSEAIMAGGGLEASATFGPAWAHVSFGANVIIYFDPFRYEADAHARISAGITIDFWIGSITISISLGARIRLEGPDFRGTVTFEVGPVELSVSFGSRNQSSREPISWSEFVVKYLEDAGDGRARVLSAITGQGSLPPGTKPGGDGEKGTADGSVAHPYEVFSEFELLVTTTVPTDAMRAGASSVTLQPGPALGLPPLNVNLTTSELRLSLRRVGEANDRLDDNWPASLGGGRMLSTTARETGNFPVAVWGPPLDLDDKKIPKGEVLPAAEGARILSEAKLVGKIPTEIAFNQVEPLRRKPLPFVAEATVRSDFLSQAGSLRSVVNDALDDRRIEAIAQDWLARGKIGTTSLAGKKRSRLSPPRLGSLAERLAEPQAEGKAKILAPSERPPYVAEVVPPRVLSVFNAPPRDEIRPRRTTVKGSERLARQPAPTLVGVQARLDPAIAARLEIVAPAAVRDGTVIAGSRVPKTRTARSASASVRALGETRDAARRLARLEDAITRTDAAVGERAARRGGAGQTSLLPGEIAVLDMPSAARAPKNQGSGRLNIASGTAQVRAFALGGAPLPVAPAQDGSIPLPTRTSRIVVIAGDDVASPGLDGWLAEMELPYVGWSSALIAGGVLRVEGASLRRGEERARTGWLRAAHLVGQSSSVTRFDSFRRSVAILVQGSVASEEGSEFLLGLSGARDSSAAPIVVSLGPLSALVFGLDPVDDARDGAFSLRFTGAAADRLAGVLAADSGAEELVQSLSNAGAEALIRPPVAASGSTLEFTWTPPGGRNCEGAP